ncbi:MAG: FAD-dependent oxidoreductase [Methylobacteriaceae bacterium]|nr:FAD-dependent oxidoreductase [Methylobacteriaceae bacterium]
MNIVTIVGAGQAGVQTAASLRQNGYAGRLILVGDEPGLPYQRPPLSKAYLKGEIEAEHLDLKPASFFAEQRIELVHDRAEAVDRTNRRIALRSGGALPYDHLVLATGAHNRVLPVPGAELDGVFGLRIREDADRLRPRLAAGRRVVVVGAGFIGLEFAAVAASLGLSVTVLELADRPLARAVTPETSAAFGRAHAGWGVRIALADGLSRIVGEAGRVTAVETTRGERLPADLVLVGIGVLPTIALAAEAGLAIENGVRVDAHLVTSDPAISAIGDAAAFPHAATGEPIRLESVQNAVDGARAVAARLAGHPAPFAPVPWFWSDQGSLKLQIAGLMGRPDETIVLGEPDALRFSVLGFRSGRLVAVESVNRPADHMAARRILGALTGPTPREASTPGFDLKGWALRPA